MTQLHLVEALAASFGIIGTVLLALNGRRAGWGFVAFLASNVGWIAFATMQDHWGLLAQQVCFTATSLLGIWIWLVRPAMQKAQKVIEDLGQGADYFDGVLQKKGAETVVRPLTADELDHHPPAEVFRVNDVLNALERQAKGLMVEADRLGDLMDYNAEFPYEDALALREAARLVRIAYGEQA
jgi:hypothetical protein